MPSVEVAEVIAAIDPEESAARSAPPGTERHFVAKCRDGAD
ncbi:hypothetical protein AB0M00_13335 [Streptomyces chartreusis]